MPPVVGERNLCHSAQLPSSIGLTFLRNLAEMQSSGPRPQPFEVVAALHRPPGHMEVRRVQVTQQQFRLHRPAGWLTARPGPRPGGTGDEQDGERRTRTGSGARPEPLLHLAASAG